MGAGVRAEGYAFTVESGDLLPVHRLVYLPGSVLCMVLIFQTHDSLLTLFCRQTLELFDRLLNVVTALCALQGRALPERGHCALRPERQFSAHPVRHNEDDDRRLILPRDRVSGGCIVTPAVIEGYSQLDPGTCAPVRITAEIDEGAL